MIIWISIPIFIYGAICAVAYFQQENLIFHPEKLDANFNYAFAEDYEEYNLKTKDGNTLNTLLFERENNKKLVVYYHGNAGTLEHWGAIAPIYLNAGFNLLIYDYRGFGKSTGKINNETDFLEDAHLFYNFAKTKYPEDDITIVGYSMGSGLASAVAAHNHPERLILKTPYFNFTKLVSDKIPWLPYRLILKYKLNTNKYLEEVSAPIHIFHGDADRVISVKHSRELTDKFPKIDYTEIKDQHHPAMNHNPQYQEFLMGLLDTVEF